jgi:hypothetical protein
MSRDQDRRRGVRVRLAAVASLETRGWRDGNNQALAVVKNVSRTGIGVETGQPPAVGHTVYLRLAIGDQTHEVEARATRVRQRGKSSFYEVGLDWSRCSPEQLAFLDEVLRLVDGQPLA